MTRTHIPPITPGMTLAVGEHDYRYGGGLALLIVQSVDVDPRLLASLEWVQIGGRRLADDGTVLGDVALWIRTSALAAAVRPTGWLPGMDERPITAAAGAPAEPGRG